VVVAMVRGKANYLTPTLQNVVGRKCLVTEVLEADNITFRPCLLLGYLRG
jgi:hypothetical protein